MVLYIWTEHFKRETKYAFFLSENWFKITAKLILLANELRIMVTQNANAFRNIRWILNLECQVFWRQYCWMDVCIFIFWLGLILCIFYLPKNLLPSALAEHMVNILENQIHSPTPPKTVDVESNLAFLVAKSWLLLSEAGAITAAWLSNSSLPRYKEKKKEKKMVFVSTMNLWMTYVTYAMRSITKFGKPKLWMIKDQIT